MSELIAIDLVIKVTDGLLGCQRHVVLLKQIDVSEVHTARSLIIFILGAVRT
jgi:hypothetical protein